MALSRFTSIVGSAHSKHPVAAGVSDFVSFYTDNESDKYFSNEILNACTCKLDYIYIWLMHGNAARVCLDFQMYLMAVIGILEEFCSPNGILAGNGPIADSPIYDWGSVEGVSGETVLRYADGPLPSCEQGYDHPALNPHVFEQCRVTDAERRGPRTAQ